MKIRTLAVSVMALSSIAAPIDKTQTFIEHLDAYFLPPFQETLPGEFGMGRLRPKSRGHTKSRDFFPVVLQRMNSGRVVDPNGPAPRLAKEAKSLRLELRVAMLHLRALPDSYSTSGLAPFKGSQAQIFVESPEPRLEVDKDSTPQERSRLMIPFSKHLEKARRDEEALLNDVILFKLTEARAGKDTAFSEKGWKFVLRPIRAESAACLSCHTDAKKGETLGVLVYMLRPVSHARE